MPRVVEGVAEEFEIVREQVGEDQQVGPRGGGGKAWQKTTLFCFKVSFLSQSYSPGDMIREPMFVKRKFWFSIWTPEMRGPLPTS